MKATLTHYPQGQPARVISTSANITSDDVRGQIDRFNTALAGATSFEWLASDGLPDVIPWSLLSECRLSFER